MKTSIQHYICKQCCSAALIKIELKNIIEKNVKTRGKKIKKDKIIQNINIIIFVLSIFFSM